MHENHLDKLQRAEKERKKQSHNSILIIIFI